MWEAEENAVDDEEFMIVMEQLNEIAETGQLTQLFTQPLEKQMEFINQIRESITEVE